MNHTRLPKDALLPDWACWDKQGTYGDRVDWVATRNKQTNMEVLAGLGETAVNIPDESQALGKTNNTYCKIFSREMKTVLWSVKSLTQRYFLATVPITIYTHNYKKAPSIISILISLHERNHKNTNTGPGCGQPREDPAGQLLQCKHILESPGQMNSEKQPHKLVAEIEVNEKWKVWKEEMMGKIGVNLKSGQRALKRRRTLGNSSTNTAW